MNGKQIKNGVLASLAGGAVMGMLMQMMGMIPMIAMLAGSQSVVVGWIVHLAISALFGVVYPVLFAKMQNQWGAGLIYGFIWYLLGPLTLMPLFMGMGVQWNIAAISGSMFSFMGHLIYGLVLGLVFRLVERQAGAGAVAAQSRSAR